MKLADLLLHTCLVMERLGLRYLITGSMASMAYGEPRFTNDIDILLELPDELITDFCAGFADEAFYFSEDAIREAVLTDYQFNILNRSSGLKLDFILLTHSEFDTSRISRARELEVLPQRKFKYSSPEDVILMKMYFYQEGGSEKHLRDIASMMRIQERKIDTEYIAEWSKQLNVEAIWDQIVVTVK